MYRDAKDKQYLNKIYASVLIRKTPYFHRPLTINGKQANVKIIKLTKKDSYLEYIGGHSNLEYDVCFLIQHAKNFDTFLFNTNVDIVATNINHQAVYLKEKVAPNNILHLPKETRNIWVFKVGTIDIFKFKLNDVVYTH
jgi:hypothetical protein